VSIASVEQLVGLTAGNLPATPPAPPRPELPGLRKAAVFLAQMSKEEAGILLGKLRPREVESITRELMRLGSVEPDDVDGVMTEFHGLMTAQRYVGRGGVDFAREILAAGLGEDKAEGILSRLNVVYTEVPFASLRNADVRQLVTFLKDEHPQVIALVLAHLTAAQSAEVLSGFAPEQQAEVAHRIATMDRTSPEMVRLVEEELQRRMGSLLAHQDMTTVGGVETLVEIINRSPRPTERSILEWLDSADPELAEQVRSQMFVFEDIVTSTTARCSRCCARWRPTTWPPRSRACAPTSGTRWSATSPSGPPRTSPRRSTCSARCARAPSRRPRRRSLASSARSRSRAS